MWHNNAITVFLQVQHYILVVQAQDNGHPSLSTTVTVYCNVLDLNDNAAIFDPMSYSNEVFENIPIGTEVVTVSATDIDSGKFQQIFFSLWIFEWTKFIITRSLCELDLKSRNFTNNKFNKKKHCKFPPMQWIP